MKKFSTAVTGAALSLVLTGGAYAADGYFDSVQNKAILECVDHSQGDPLITCVEAAKDTYDYDGLGWAEAIGLLGILAFGAAGVDAVSRKPE